MIRENNKFSGFISNPFDWFRIFDVYKKSKTITAEERLFIITMIRSSSIAFIGVLLLILISMLYPDFG